MSVREHKENAAALSALRCAILTVSDTRTERTDRSGSVMRSLVQEAGHQVVSYHIVPDAPHLIESRVLEATTQADVVLLTGGTGISRRDTTTDMLALLLDKTLDGFGELFRMLSFEDIGSAAMLSRAIGGVIQGTLVFAMPGALAAVTLALRKLILPELPHLVSQIRR